MGKQMGNLPARCVDGHGDHAFHTRAVGAAAPLDKSAANAERRARIRGAQEEGGGGAGKHSRAPARGPPLRREHDPIPIIVLATQKREQLMQKHRLRFSAIERWIYPHEICPER